MLEHQVVFNVSYLFNNFYNEREAFLSKKINKAIFTFEIKFLKMGKIRSPEIPHIVKYGFPDEERFQRSNDENDQKA